MTAPIAGASMGEKPTTAFGIAKAVFKRIGIHNVNVIAAGISFYAVLALVPTLLAAALTFALVVDPDEIQAELEEQVASLDAETQEFAGPLVPEVMDQVRDTRDAGAGPVVLALVLALWSASGAVQKLMSITAAAYEVVDTRAGWKMRLFAYGCTAAAIVLVGLLVGVLGVLPAVADTIGLGDATQLAIRIGTVPAIALIVYGAFTFLYRYSPDRDPRTPWWNWGAVVATVIFLLIALVFTAFSSLVASMGAVGIIGSVAVIMLFFQFSTIAIVVGAEINAVREPANSRAVQQGVQETATVKPVPIASEPLSLGKALAGVAALFVLGRGN